MRKSRRMLLVLLGVVVAVAVCGGLLIRRGFRATTEPTRLEKVVARSVLKEHPRIGVIYTDAEYFGEKTGRWRVPKFELLSLIRMNFIDVCALFRKAVWEDVGGYDEQMPWMGLEDWDFWLRIASRGGSFFHLPQIGFDYRVRKGSQIVETIGCDLRLDKHSQNANANPRFAKLIDYIFSKPELAFYRWVRETDEEVHQLRGGIQAIQNSPSYRLGRGILAPARLLRKLWRAVFH